MKPNLDFSDCGVIDIVGSYFFKLEKVMKIAIQLGSNDECANSNAIKDFGKFNSKMLKLSLKKGEQIESVM